MLALVFIMPWGSLNWLMEALVVLIGFPLIVSLGAGSSLAPGWGKFCQILGNLSYPLYMTHYAAIWVFGNYYTNRQPPPGELAVIIVLGVVLLVAFAYVNMVLIDIPVRRYLLKKYLSKD